MNVRELLQKEIWSKRTTRKIWIGFAVVVIVFLLCRVAGRYWLTPMECKSGKAALALVDDLQNYGAMSDAQYDAIELKARQEVENADQAAWTARDSRIAGELSYYLTLVEVNRTESKHQVLVNQGKIPQLDELELKVNAEELEAQKYLGVKLHRALK